MEVVLDQDTAHLKLLVSEDGKHVTIRGSLLGLSVHFKRSDTNHYEVGQEGYTSGTHCWMVALSHWGDCILGVAQELVRGKRKGMIFFYQK